MDCVFCLGRVSVINRSERFSCRARLEWWVAITLQTTCLYHFIHFSLFLLSIFPLTILLFFTLTFSPFSFSHSLSGVGHMMSFYFIVHIGLRVISSDRYQWRSHLPVRGSFSRISSLTFICQSRISASSISQWVVFAIPWPVWLCLSSLKWTWQLDNRSSVPPSVRPSVRLSVCLSVCLYRLLVIFF